MNWNYPALMMKMNRSQVSGTAHSQVAGRSSQNSKTGRGLTALLLLTMLAGAALAAFHFAPALPASSASLAPQTAPFSSLPSNSFSPSHPSVRPISLPMFFEANQGQTDSRVKFLARGAGYGLFLTAHEAVLKLQAPAAENRLPGLGSQPLANPAQPSSAVIRMRLDGAQPAALVSGASPLPGKSNYFIGNDPKKWRRDVPHYGRVEYSDVYPGVDLAYYGTQGQLEYDFRVAPGADPSRIAMTFDGASAKLDASDLVLATASGDVRFHTPHIYQTNGSVETTVSGSFRQLAGNRIGFEIGPYDKTRDLIIDPTLAYATYIGGSGGGGAGESNVQVAFFSAANLFVAGSTTSTDFPVPAPSQSAFSPVQDHNAGQSDVFVAELNPTNTVSANQLIYSTYLGGAGSEQLAGMAVDLHGNVYVAGITDSTDFPTNGQAPAFQTASDPKVDGRNHGFLSMIGGDGKTTVYGNLANLFYSTYLAGNGIDVITGLAIDGNLNAFVTGHTTSTNSADGFPSTTNALQPCPWQPGVVVCNQPSGPTQFFATKVYTGQSVSGPASMLYSTYFGGGNPSNASAIGGGIAVDFSGNMYITGTTTMLPVPVNGGAAFPILYAPEPQLNLGTNTTQSDAFVAKINPTQNQNPGLAYSTYLGGSGNDGGVAIAVDSASNAYVTGFTQSPDFIPANLTGMFQKCLNNQISGSSCTSSSGFDAFVAKIGNVVSGTAPINYATYIGGSGDEFGLAIAADTLGVAHVAGSTSTPNDGSFPLTGNFPPGSPLATFGGGASDAFVAALGTANSLGNSLAYLGGSDQDQGTSIAFDKSTNTSYVAGFTRSADFPTTPSAYQPTLHAGAQQNAFVTEISPLSALALTQPSGTPSPSPANVGNTVTFKFTVTNPGPEAVSSGIFTAILPANLSAIKSVSATIDSGTCAPYTSGPTISCTIPSLGASASVTATVTLTPTVSSTISVSGVASLPDGSQSNVIQETDDVNDYTISVTPNQQAVDAGGSVKYTVVVTPVPSYSATITLSVTGLPTGASGTWVPPNAEVTPSGSRSVSAVLSIATTARPVTSGSLLRRGPWYATLLPVSGLSLLGLGLGAGFRRRRWLAFVCLALLMTLIALQPACSSSSSSTTTNTGTPAGTYKLSVSGSSGSSSTSHNQTIFLLVN